MICQVCGTYNDDSHAFCRSCGSSLSASGVTVVNQDASGASLTPRCPHCGAELVSGGAFCEACGARVVPENTLAAATPIPTLYGPPPTASSNASLVGGRGGQGPSKSRMPFIVGGIALALLLGVGLFAGGMFFARGSQGAPKLSEGHASSISEKESEGSRVPGKGAIEVVNSVTVPDLRNMTPSEAQETLEALGLVGQKGDDVYDAGISVGHICSQSPSAGTEVYTDKVVTYQLSKGEQTVAVPDVTGLDQAGATSLLEGAGFVVEVDYEESSSVAAGDVIRQSITGSVSPGSTVGITVSKGAPRRQQPQQTQQPRQTQAPKNFPSVWVGSYEGSTSEADIVVRPFSLTFDTVGSDGSLSGTCEILDQDDKNAQVCAYRIKGYVDWSTDEFFVEGTSWINKGDMVAMNMFKGKVDYSSMTMVGIVWSKDEDPTRSWSAQAV